MGKPIVPFVAESVLVRDITHEGLGVGQLEDGRVVFIDQAVPGDVVAAEVFGKSGSVLRARIGRFITLSPIRRVPVCAHFSYCGGCSLQHVTYESQLRLKRDVVVSNFKRIADIVLHESVCIEPSDVEFYYRNKIEYSFASQAWLPRDEFKLDTNEIVPSLGFHVPQSFSKVFHVRQCHIANSLYNDIRNFAFREAIRLSIAFYNPLTKLGVLRHLVIRSTNHGTGLLCLLVVTSDGPLIELLLKSIWENFRGCLDSVWLLVNDRPSDYYSDILPIHVYGDKFLLERIGDYLYRVSPLSFFQVNIIQATKLYEYVYSIVEGGDTTAYDLYCGAATITLFLSTLFKRVVGMEISGASVSDAHYNIEINKVTNITLLEGDATTLFDSDTFEKYGFPEVLILDPPRAGLSPKLIAKVLNFRPQSIVYISCNPATQARDLVPLLGCYTLDNVRLFDMFPNTMHIESVVKMIRID